MPFISRLAKAGSIARSMLSRCFSVTSLAIEAVTGDGI